jgi:hypothetical protein
MRKLLLVLDATLPEDSRLDAGTRTVLLLELGEGRIERFGFRSRQSREGELQDPNQTLKVSHERRNGRNGKTYLVNDPSSLVLL